MSSVSERTTEVIRHHWDHRAGTFDGEAGHGLFSDQQRRAWLLLLGRLAGPTPRRVLDVGCGTGFLALRFAELGHTVTGIDLAPAMIAQARCKAEQAQLAIDFQVGDAVCLDSPDASYDLVVARHVIWNLPDPERGLSEWLRVLRPGGRLALVEGKWADNESFGDAPFRPPPRPLVRAVDTVARRLPESWAKRKLFNWRYNRLEFDLPFSGGPPAEQLVDFLDANCVRDIAVEPLMDAAYWGEVPDFPRYLVSATRP